MTQQNWQNRTVTSDIRKLLYGFHPTSLLVLICGPASSDIDFYWIKCYKKFKRKTESHTTRVFVVQYNTGGLLSSGYDKRSRKYLVVLYNATA